MTAVSVPTPTLADRLVADRRVAVDRTIAVDLALVMGAAVLTAIAAQIRVPLSFTPVPVTGQTLVVLLAGATLGARRGAASQALYWAAGIVAPMPWYAGDETGSSIRAGWEVATGTTAGYLLGFVVAAGLVGHLAQRGQDRSVLTSVPAMLAGSVAIYALGAAWLSLQLDVPLATGETNAIGLGVTPFLVGDLLKATLAGLATPAAWAGVRLLDR